MRKEVRQYNVRRGQLHQGDVTYRLVSQEVVLRIGSFLVPQGVLVPIAVLLDAAGDIFQQVALLFGFQRRPLPL